MGWFGAVRTWPKRVWLSDAYVRKVCPGNSLGGSMRFRVLQGGLLRACEDIGMMFDTVTNVVWIRKCSICGCPYVMKRRTV